MLPCRSLPILLLALLAIGQPLVAGRKAPARPVDLNHATATELMQLPGVGARTAERILAWRKQYGPFLRVEEVMAVRGVGEKGYLRLKPHLSVGRR